MKENSEESLVNVRIDYGNKMPRIEEKEPSLYACNTFKKGEPNPIINPDNNTPREHSETELNYGESQGVNESPNFLHKENKNNEHKFENYTLKMEIDCGDPEQSNTVLKSKIEEKSPVNKNPITIDSNILKRVTKHGWTYTPTKTNRKLDVFLDDPTDNEIHKEKLIENSQSSINSEKYSRLERLKSKFSFLKISRKNSKKNAQSNLKYTKIHC
ncbi:hypothetical protein HHI36_007484 [Cryptolaemus montrouzieri]|uniref:Uncharacterized protein n=1 Tax=Cryptolaemus montrouzieri TaxID=559131 RepID=A0ABD2MPM6_9CUCU